MKKIGIIFKETSENRIRTALKDSNCFFVVKYSGVASPDLSGLRTSLKSSNASLFVVKNSVARRALESSGHKDTVKNIEGPCGLVFVQDEPVDASKVLYEFTKKHKELILQGGFLKDKVLEQKDIEELAKLPSKEVMRAKLVMTLNAPISGFVMVLNNTLKKFVICIDKIREKKATQEGGKNG